MKFIGKKINLIISYIWSHLKYILLFFIIIILSIQSVIGIGWIIHTILNSSLHKYLYPDNNFIPHLDDPEQNDLFREGLLPIGILLLIFALTGFMLSFYRVFKEDYKKFTKHYYSVNKII